MIQRFFIICLSLFTLSACESTYYAAMEKVGQHKRDILVDRVESASESQEEAQQEFKDALTHLSTLINFDGDDLARQYDISKNHFEESKAAAEDVTKRIDSIESVANALFEEWQDELSQYSNANLKRDSEQKLKQTQRQFSKLLKSMRRSEAKMQPVLDSLKDNVLYLKHNLNAQAVAAIRGEFDSLKVDIQNLINDMNRSIADSNAFIEQMNVNKAG